MSDVPAQIVLTDPADDGDEDDDGGRPADPLRLTLCPACGYDLTGLPDLGTCPECGIGYDRNDGITLFGSAAGSLANVTNISDREFAKYFGVWLVALVLFGGEYLVWRHVSGRHVAVAASGVLLSLRIATWLTAPVVGTVRIRLTGDGVRQDDTSPVAATVYRVALVGCGVAAVTAVGWVLSRTNFSHAGGRQLVLLCILGAAAVAALIALWTYRTGAAARALALFGIGPAVANRADRFHPWAFVRRAMLADAGRGYYHLQLRRRSALQEWSLVDAYVRLTPAQAEQVHQWIRICMRSGA